jgi:biotin carboxyl carrier protein
MQYPHWLMVAGAVLVVVGFIGFALHKNNAEPVENNLKQEAAPPEEPRGAPGLAHQGPDRVSRGTGRSAEGEGEEMSEIMGTEIKVPKIAGVSKLSIGRWFKRVGDPVSIGEPLVEIDTYNLTHEIQAPATGILSKVLVKDGGSVEPGTVVGTIDQV